MARDWVAMARAAGDWRERRTLGMAAGRAAAAAGMDRGACPFGAGEGDQREGWMIGWTLGARARPATRRRGATAAWHAARAIEGREVC